MGERTEQAGGTQRGRWTRRRVLQGATGAAAALAAGPLAASAVAADEPSPPTAGGASGPNGSPATAGPVAVKGRVRQSLVHWCYSQYWDVPRLCDVARRLGCASVELIAVEHWPTLRQHGLTCAISGSHGFVQGMNNPRYREQVLATLRQRIDQCAEAGVPSVITFTGMREDIADDVGAKNCVEGYKQIIGHAEKRKVTLCLEMLNSRATGTMKGHPGYQGDHTEYCIDIIRRVGSERMKLLFDIYHVQIMDGDVITRIRQWKEYIGHVHTAGVPGRGELDNRQEINYPPIMQALVDVGYNGFVGQEFMPTRDPWEGLVEAVRVCDV